MVTFFGTGLGPAEGQGFVLDGALRATAQPAPYPTLTLIQPQTIRTQTPGLFAAEGIAAALNQDGSRHSASSPAAAGEVIQLFATGLGAIDTNIPIGDFFSATAPVCTTIDGVDAEVLFSGGAPGLIGGVNQVNARIPAGLTPGAHAMQIAILGQTSPAARVLVR